MEATEEYPFVLITGRLLEHFNTGEMTRRAAKLKKLKPEAFLDINPTDAQTAGLSDNTEVCLISPYGAVRIKLRISDSMQSCYLFAPIHFSRPARYGDRQGWQERIALLKDDVEGAGDKRAIMQARLGALPHPVSCGIILKPAIPPIICIAL